MASCAGTGPAGFVSQVILRRCWCHAFAQTPSKDPHEQERRTGRPKLRAHRATIAAIHELLVGSIFPRQDCRIENNAWAVLPLSEGDCKLNNAGWFRERVSNS